MISAGAKILGSITIYENSKIGAGSVVLKDVPPNSTVVGIPGRVVKNNNNKIHYNDLNQSLPDIVSEEINELKEKIKRLELKLDKK